MTHKTKTQFVGSGQPRVRRLAPRSGLVLLSALLALAVTTALVAVDKKAPQDVDSDALTAETQVSVSGSGDNHTALVWWIPNEFWQAILARDASTDEADKQAILDAMAGTSLVAVVQADISTMGAFDYYTREEIAAHMVLTVVDARGQKQTLVPLKEIKPGLEVVLGVFKPILGAAMGNLGRSLEFFVINDVVPKGRVLDPYQKSKFEVRLARRDGAPLNAAIEMPLNALFVPRKCPGGQDAHISWKFCPWTGEKLND